ncbi:hypothetical protein SAMN05444397_11118 [Flavobacterium aquidurense]|uniref:Amidohydrolase n=1 Tax=Flavobacterium frigidimaris TaxID=262320 RepID=A0ABX4BNH9_FLAFR|nr:amidohydrolase family protein [Flavobacterium frigidimaris]OXA77425.1 amidohydrolase [Flavobacterium frigidimaris]SDZ62642.1 hypothetical protein SAMN05444397_11118 [Flavobacterium aquidurense]
MKIITLEEHFINPAIAKASADIIERLAPSHRAAYSNYSSNASFDKMTDLGPIRIAEMDANGIDMQVLSIGGPGIQLIAPQEAVPLAIAVNDELEAAVKANPTRLVGLATLPTTNPEAAALELERTVTKLGFKGAMISGATNDKFLDEDEFIPILEMANQLKVPIYLHPTTIMKSVRDIYYNCKNPDVSARFAASGWGWHMEVGIHIVHMILNGTFDKYPNLQMITGHWGEMVPFLLDRMDEQMPQELTRLDRNISDYYRNHVHITPSGMFTMPLFKCALEMMGADRIMFSVDYPYVGNEGARAFLENAPISESDKEKIAHGNAEKLLNL